MKLRDALSHRRNDLYARLQVIESKARQLLEYSQGGSHLTFTTHGFSHISRVEENYDWLLSEEDISEFIPFELFILLCATFFHDALMIPTHIGDEEDARREHAVRAKKFLIKNLDILDLSIHEANAIAEVILGHAVNSFEDLMSETVIVSSLVDIRKMAACLSMADICHADSSRVPEIVVRHLELDEESAYHWRRHLQISGIARKAERLIMSAVFFSEEGESAVLSYKGEIERQLEIVRPYFSSRLSPITGIDLQGQKLRSQLDVTLRFQANTRAILDILIEGVYQRQDVFIRELIQNSLDACHIRLAKLFKRGEIFHPRIVVSLLQVDGNLRAVRVDDNGVGMDVGDIQDTVLWIGNSISTKGDIRRLLNETTGKSLIASFGIGLLSCFKSASSLLIRSTKEGRSPVQVKISSISDEIKPVESPDKSIGSTFIVELKEGIASDLDLKEAVRHYFRMVQQASIELMSLESSSVSRSYGRDDLLRMATTESLEIKPVLPGEDSSPLAFQQIKGDDFLAWLWIPRSSPGRLELKDGTLDILNDGVYVSTDSAKDWLPEYLAVCEGMLNFSPGAIDLPVSRDKVVSNKKLVEKRAQLSSKSISIIEKLVESTKSSDMADDAALMIASCLRLADDESKKKIIRRLDSYRVSYFQRERSVSLLKIREGNPVRVYVEYSLGRWVSDLGKVDGQMLYHQSDDLTHLQAALLRQNGGIVLSAKRLDMAEEDDIVLEADLLKEYFSFHKIEVIDLAEGRNIIGGMLQAKPFSKTIKNALGKSIKFIEVEGLPNKRAWRVDRELWVNVAHPRIGSIYNLIKGGSVSPEKMQLVKVLLDLLAYDFEGAIENICRLISGDSSNVLSDKGGH